MQRNLLIVLLILFMVSCNLRTRNKYKFTDDVIMAQVHDPHSYAKPTEAVLTNLSLTLRVNFDEQKLDGIAEWDYYATDTAMAIYLDVHHLHVTSVRDELNASLPYELGPVDSIMGQYLKISIAGHPQRIRIKYETTENSEALQWLNAEQTAGKRNPFLYTQSQPIYARTWIPCQDSPGIRFTYNAKVHVPEGLIAVMSAENPVEKREEDEFYVFTQPNPIPSYLMALAVGELGFRSIGDRTGVYAEPIMLDTAAREFIELETMLNEAENLFGPYVWKRYDVLVLPPSFPYGGMENPMLTFATPTVIAGDRSLVSLIAHELAHSWSGNLVTDVTWNDFWLNEGLTVYLERRLMERMYDTSYVDMLTCLGYEDLQLTLADMESIGDTLNSKLKLSLNGHDPEEGLTDVAYEKGYLFLHTIEKVVGRKRFDLFLTGYFKKYSFRAMSTEKFIDELYAGLIKKGSVEDQTIDVQTWVYRPGMPENFEEPHSYRFDMVDRIAKKYLAGGLRLSDIDASKWTSHEFQEFLRAVKMDVNKEQMVALDEKFGFTYSGNCEILALWLEASIRHNYEVAYPLLEKFLNTVGRKKYLTPLYTALMETEATKKMGKKFYQQARKNYHTVTTKSLDKLILEETITDSLVVTVN